MNAPEFALFLVVYGGAAVYCGWCLCLWLKFSNGNERTDEKKDRTKQLINDDWWDN